MFGKFKRKMSKQDKEAKSKEEAPEVQEEQMVSEETTEEQKTEQSKEPSFEDQLKEANDKYLRLYAEFENFRRRTAKERLDLIANAGGDILKEILPVLDDMERAIKVNQDATEAASIKEGFELVHNKLKNTLAQKGLKEMDSAEADFDTDKHEAITKIPAPTEELKGKVVDVIEKGYYLNDKVLRYAKVVIGE